MAHENGVNTGNDIVPGVIFLAARLLLIFRVLGGMGVPMVVANKAGRGAPPPTAG